MTNPTAKSLTLDLLSTLRGRPMPVRALVEAARLFGIEQNNVRVCLARLAAAEIVEHDERGLYRLGRSAAAVERQVTSWRRLEERTREWTGGWIAVHGSPATRGKAGRRTDQALRFIGFRELEAGLQLRPDNLVGGVAAVRAELAGLGLPEHSPVFGITDLDPQREASARGLWETAPLLDRYAHHQAEIATSHARLDSLTVEEAMVESFLLGGSVLRMLVLDPLLPDDIMDAGPRNRLVASMRDYDRTGRAAWAEFLQGHGVVQLQAPADLRVGQAESRFADLMNNGVNV